MELLTPPEVAMKAVATGKAKVALHGSPARLALLAVLAGCYIALGGILSLITGFGFPEASAANPALQKLISGATFPLGLILVVVLGAELFTGNNALLVPAYMQGHYGMGTMLKNWTIVYFGNLVGAVLFTWLFVYYAGLTHSDPWHSAIVNIGVAKTSMPWGVVFVKGIGANWCVCLAVWLAMSGRTLVDKIAGCWFPVMAFVALGYEHSIANMFYIPLAMMEGAPVGIWQSITSSFIPATLGNIAGGAIFVGCVYAWLNIKKTEK